MEIGKYIDELIKLRQAHGADLKVVSAGAGSTNYAVTAPLPRIAHMAKDKPRRFWVEGQELDSKRGDKVVRI